MRSFRRLALGLVGVTILAAIVISGAAGAGASGSATRDVEFQLTDESNAGPTPYGGSIVNRSFERGHGDEGRQQGQHGEGGKRANSNPELSFSFEGLNFFQQRYANNQNQFSVEPPDQGLCAGNGYVFEAVNDVLNVYDTTGHSVLPADTNTPPVPHVNGTVDLNTFYHYPAAINRSTGVRGPILTDPVCHFDQPTQRWFVVVLTLDAFTNGQTKGSNHFDIAVSNGPNPVPLSNWTIYKIPVQNDGTEGTPDHHCHPATTPRPRIQPTNPRACIADYPHIGADANGIYITSNEYDFYGDEFQSANIYAFSKKGLESGNTSHVLLETKNSVHGQPGFTVWPALSPPGQFKTDDQGTEYFLSSNAADEATCPTGCVGPGISHELVVWALSNTESLGTATPAVQLTNKVLNVLPYAVPAKSNQKVGSVPLADCLNDRTLPTPFGPGCWQLFFNPPPPPPAIEGVLDSHDTRMQQVWYSNGKLYGALDTALTLDKNRAAIEWFVVNPGGDDGARGAKIRNNGYLGLAGNNITYPAIATTANGRGVMAFTVTGDDYYPSAGYAGIDANGVSDIHIAEAGKGPQDGFTEYPAFTPRPRWGDYGAAVLDGKSIWIASEYIAQTCTFDQYKGSPAADGTYGRLSTGFGLCGNTRGPLGNWSTRISKITPKAGGDNNQSGGDH